MTARAVTDRPYNKAREWNHLRQGKYDKRLFSRRFRIINGARAASDHSDVLLTILSLICNRHGMGTHLELCNPQFLSRIRIKRAETLIIRRRNENQSARCRDRSTHAHATRVPLSL